MTLDIGRRCVYFCVERTRSCSVLCAGACMSHLLVMYNRNHTCLVSSHISVLVERLVSVVVKCVVKDQQVGPFCSGFVYVAINFFFKSQRSILVSCGLALSQDATTVLTWVPSRFGQLQSLRKRMESCLGQHRSFLKVRRSHVYFIKKQRAAQNDYQRSEGHCRAWVWKVACGA